MGAAREPEALVVKQLRYKYNLSISDMTDQINVEPTWKYFRLAARNWISAGHVNLISEIRWQDLYLGSS